MKNYEVIFPIVILLSYLIIISRYNAWVGGLFTIIGLGICNIAYWIVALQGIIFGNIDIQFVLFGFVVCISTIPFIKLELKFL